MKPHRRSPYRRRADGQLKGTALVRIWGWIDGDRGPMWPSAYRTRSRRWSAGTRRIKHATKGTR